MNERAGWIMVVIGALALVSVCIGLSVLIFHGSGTIMERMFG